uniref:Ran-binding protein 10 n=1 Tax=Cacopsylla melanoneura TaxID=428564 RepID=A0A8D8VVP6_9HEMI
MAAFTSNVDVKIDLKSSNSANVDRLKLLYPMVNEEETPLPRSWSPKDKFNYIGLSQNNLRVHYKGHGKTHKDAASVRATHPIPPACGLYYFEVKIVSKGRDGYMGIGLSAQGVNMNRLPGWDKHSYGYHGDDGHSFCSSGTGQPYGPTFTTGDVIGCGVNLIDNTCFYTKNGHHLGTAFTDLPANLYPTVGLQTPGEIVDANFGQAPFVFNIEDIILELKQNCQNTILNYQLHGLPGDPQDILRHMVSSYLVHHGYCVTAQAFAKETHQTFDEEITSIINRQKILKLVLAGRLGEAIDTTSRLYPGLLSHNRNLLFLLKCRQFVEMVNGTDTAMVGPSPSPPVPADDLMNGGGGETRNTRICSCGNGVAVNGSAAARKATKYQNGNTRHHKPSSNSPTSNSNGAPSDVASSNGHSLNGTSTTNNNPSSTNNQQQQSTNSTNHPPPQQQDEDMTSSSSPLIEDVASKQTASLKTNSSTSSSNGSSHHTNTNTSTGSTNTSYTNGTNHSTVQHNGNHIEYNNGDTSMYTNEDDMNEDEANGVLCHVCSERDEEMDVDPSPKRQLLCAGSKPAIERMLEFGRELYLFSEQLRQEQEKNEINQKMLQDAFSLLAYSNPWNSPVGWQLDPIQRETVCAALNSAILESSNLARRPPLEVSVAHARQLISLMSKKGLGACAFAHVDEILNSTMA